MAMSGKICSRSRTVSSLTKQPRPGSRRTRPSVASTLRASRSGVREMPSCSVSPASSTHAPAPSAWVRIMVRKRSATSRYNACRTMGVVMGCP
ncbi:Uncharacterised protein [Bordetella pertussis]|nr:Uncharacterised protein [Bordetella pertussis]CFW35674.1 Uncharacterised protein [Bordetella pertussis]